MKRGEVEIEYEGINFIQEYRATLVYLGIVGGSKTKLEDTGFEAPPNRVVKPQTASHATMLRSPSPRRMPRGYGTACEWYPGRCDRLVRPLFR